MTTTRYHFSDAERERHVIEATGDAERIPGDAMLDATVLAISIPEDGRRVLWEFLIEDPWFFGRQVWGDTSTKFVAHPQCNMFRWVGALLGTDLPEGYRLDSETLLGLRCRVLIGARKGRMVAAFNWVEDVLSVDRNEAPR